MVNVDEKTFAIRLSRGDTLDLRIAFTGDIPQEGDTVIFTVKDSIGDTGAMIEKEMELEGSGVCTVSLASSDTEEMHLGNYLWDVRIFYAGGSVLAPFEPRPFRLCGTVTGLRD